MMNITALSLQLLSIGLGFYSYALYANLRRAAGQDDDLPFLWFKLSMLYYAAAMILLLFLR